MSSDLHESCLTWDAHTGRGRARHDGVDVALSRPPDIGAPKMRALYFAPMVAVYEIAEGIDARRDMTRAEVEAAMAMLNEMASAARGRIKEGLK